MQDKSAKALARLLLETKLEMRTKDLKRLQSVKMPD